MGKSFQKCTILIIRISAIGDIIMSSPVPTALKRQNPNSTISWLVDPKFATLLEGHPDIDEVIPFDIENWNRLWRQKKLTSLYRSGKALRQKLRERNYDKTIDLQGNFATGLISMLSGALHRIVLSAEGGSTWFMTKTISRNLGDQVQIGSEYRYLVNQLGCSDTNWKMHVPRSPSAQQTAQIKIHDALKDEPYAVICPFAQYPQKNWFEDYWEQIVLRLRGRYQLRTVIVGGDNGQEQGERIARLCGATNFAGRTSLSETATIISQAKLVIGVDTGLTHMGHAFQVPTISLFGATYPYAYVDSEMSKVIYLDRFCSPCRRNPTCGKKYQCMREITPDKVLTAIKPLLKQSSSAKRAP